MAPVPCSPVRELFRVPRWVLVIGLPLLAVLVLVGAWAVDALMHRGKVSRNVSVAGETVGGLSDEELAERIDHIAERFSRTPILIRTADGDSEWTAGELGVGVDVDATMEAVRSAGTGGPVAPLTWIGTLGGTEKVEVQLAVDLEMTREALRGTDVLRTQPSEPTITTNGSALEVVAGSSTLRTCPSFQEPGPSSRGCCASSSVSSRSKGSVKRNSPLAQPKPHSLPWSDAKECLTNETPIWVMRSPVNQGPANCCSSHP